MAADISEKHHLVDFASRYASASIKTFNAASALWRAEGLLTDIEALITLSDEAEKKEIQFGSIFTTYEIISYYAVGLVTCLEWHARSRLVDMMVFRPSCIRTADLKGIADLAISQIVAGGVTIPHLLGAATNVSSVKEYVTIFSRLFEELGTKSVSKGNFAMRRSKVQLKKYRFTKILRFSTNIEIIWCMRLAPR